jgi:hypothetical protein
MKPRKKNLETKEEKGGNREIRRRRWSKNE